MPTFCIAKVQSKAEIRSGFEESGRKTATRCGTKLQNIHQQVLQVNWWAEDTAHRIPATNPEYKAGYSTCVKSVLTEEHFHWKDNGKETTIMYCQ